MDASRGTGLAPQAWSRPEHLDDFLVGYAGGIGPANIRSVLRDVAALGRPCWVDMESGIRSDNQFDAEKAEAVLRAAAEF
jgi:phosphoribosylanthranilate isomerase